ncbi:MAG: hypothetical protein ACYC0C_14670 [Devosia sp.]
MKLQELVRALCVVALVFLNFGHAPVAMGGEYATTLQASSFCGDPIDGPLDAKADPCQACRIGAGMVLPPAPEIAVSVATASAQYLVAPSSGWTPGIGGRAQPRAPPLA